MRAIFLLALAAQVVLAQPATITDTITTPMGGNWSGTVVVSLNSPGLAQPLYAGSVTLSGWSQTVTVTAGAFSLALYPNDQITPGGTSYQAKYSPTSGAGWTETWVVPTGATTIREIRSTTLPSPTVKFNLSQLNQNGALLGQGLRWNGAAWAPGNFAAATATGDLSLTLSAPASSTAACVAGTVKASAAYVFVCTATNTWKRVALESW